MNRKKVSLEALEENYGYVDTRSSGFVWRDEIDEAFFPGISCSLLNWEQINSLIDNIVDEQRFFEFSEFLSPIGIEEYLNISDILRENLRFFQHRSIHMLQKAWEMVSGGGDSISHFEIVCLDKTLSNDNGRVFACLNESSGICAFHLASNNYSDYKSIFEWKKSEKTIKVTKDKFESTMAAISLRTCSSRIEAELAIARFFEANYESKLANKSEW